MGNCRSSIGIAKDKGKENEDKLEPPSEKTLMKKQELKDVAESDGIKWEEGDAWYVVEAAWVRKWLAYIEGEDSATKPDPINNKLLLVVNTETNRREPKPLLRAAGREHMGHYRRVNQHVWNLWCRTYGSSGPAITVTSPPFEDTSNWTVDPNYDWEKGEQTGAATVGGSQERGGGAPVEASVSAGDKAVRGSGGTRHSSSGAQQPNRGDMEDDGVGAETTAQAAAFFDVKLNSPSASQGVSNTAAGGGGASATAAATRSSETSISNDEDRKPSAAEHWMYGAESGLLME